MARGEEGASQWRRGILMGGRDGIGWDAEGGDTGIGWDASLEAGAGGWVGRAGGCDARTGERRRSVRSAALTAAALSSPARVHIACVHSRLIHRWAHMYIHNYSTAARRALLAPMPLINPILLSFCLIPY